MDLVVPWFRRLVVGLSPPRPRFDPRPVQVGSGGQRGTGAGFSPLLLTSTHYIHSFITDAI